MRLATRARSRASCALAGAWVATPEPKWVVAAGDCACTGGVFAGSYACLGPVAAAIAVDLQIKGCPPTPMLQGLLALLEHASTAVGAPTATRP